MGDELDRPNNGDGSDLKKPDQPLTQSGLTITYDAASETYHVTNDLGATLPLTVIIIQAIATLTETDPHALEPLAKYIDPDHLEGLFASPVSAQSPTVSFTYEGRHVTVRSPTEVTITP